MPLTDDEAARRLATDGPNELPRSPDPSVLTRAARHLFEPLSLVLIAAALASVVALGHTVEGLAIASIVVLNVAIGVTQERQAASAVAALEELTAPTARVRRVGSTKVIPARDVVRGDVVELLAGDRVAADLTLTEAAALAIDEAILTGESVPADKQVGATAPPGSPPAERRGEAFAGTMVVRGRGTGIVTDTGSATEVGTIAASLTDSTVPPLVTELRSVAARMSGLALVIGASLVPIVFVRSRGNDGALVTAILAGVALAVAAIPEGLATIVTGALALGARRMARRGAIVRRLPAIEALGSASVICTDKTGTLTTGQLTVTATEIVGGRDREFWLAALRCNDGTTGTGDPVDVALAAAAHRAGADGPVGERVAERPFDVETRSMATVHVAHGAPALTVKGAPEVVLQRCVPGPERDALARAVDDLTGAGLRVLAVATAISTDLDANGLRPLGLAAFADPLRPSAIDAIAECRRAGIRVVLVTGDHIVTAHSVAAAAGIDDGDVIAGSALAALPDDHRAELLRKAAVVARVDPLTKVELIDAHRATGAVVAMTGDGVNDAPALRHADIGVAVAGEAGTDVARQAAQLVVTNGDLGTLVAAVREGRRIYRNLRAVVGYLLTGNISEVLVVVATVLLIPELAVPLLPVQLLWVNLITDGLPALALGVDRPAGDPLAEPPRPRGGHLLTARRLGALGGRAAAIATAVIASALIGRRWGWDDEQVRTQLLLSLLAAHLLLAYTARAQRWTFEPGWWRNKILLAAVGGSLTLQALAFGTAAGRAALALGALPPAGWVLAASAAVAAICVIDAARRIGAARGAKR